MLIRIQTEPRATSPLKNVLTTVVFASGLGVQVYSEERLEQRQPSLQESWGSSNNKKRLRNEDALQARGRGRWLIADSSSCLKAPSGSREEFHA